MVQYLREEVSVGSVVHDEVSVVVLLHNPVEGDNVWMGRREAMEGYFPHVQLALAGATVNVRTDEALDGVVARKRIYGSVNDTIASYAKDLDEFESIVVDERTQGWGRGGSRGGLLRRHPGITLQRRMEWWRPQRSRGRRPKTRNVVRSSGK